MILSKKPRFTSFRLERCSRLYVHCTYVFTLCLYISVYNSSSLPLCLCLSVSPRRAVRQGYVAVLHRAHPNGFCSALQQLFHSVALLLLSAAASSVLDICTACIVGLARANSAKLRSGRRASCCRALRAFKMLTYPGKTLVQSTKFI